MNGMADLCGTRAVVIAAHPDDEVIGAGALLMRMPEAAVIHVTDGAPRDGRDALTAGLADWADYAAARHREAETALAVAGIDPRRLIGLGIPDQEATFSLVSLTHRIVDILRDGGFDAAVAHAYEGGHPDHDASAFAIHAAHALVERGGRKPPVLIEMSGYHGLGGTFNTGGFLPHPDAGPVATVELDEAEREVKRRMIDCHATQRGLLAAFPLDAERFRRAPRYDFRLPPHAGRLNYERWGWSMTGEGWRRLARTALAELELAD